MGVYATVAAMGLQLLGGLSQASAQKKQAKYQAQVAANNAAIAEQNANNAIVAGQAAEKSQRLKGNQELGQETAQAGASGLSTSSDTIAQSLAGQAMVNEADALNVRNNYQSQANAYRQQAQAYRDESSYYSAAGKSSVLNTLLSTGGSVAGSWYKMFGDTKTSPTTTRETT